MFSLIQEDELITLVLSCFVFFFIFIKRSSLKNIPFSRTLILSYTILFLGWIATILEGFFLSKSMNELEHFCYTANVGLLTFWCYQFFYLNGNKK